MEEKGEIGVIEKLSELVTRWIEQKEFKHKPQQQ